jgi:threonine/homoserine efflux transporter RhtA
MHQKKTAGESYEAALRARRNVVGVHWVLAIVSAVSLLVLLPAQGLNTSFTRGAGLVIVFETIFGWAPYVVSGFYAPSVLDGNHRAVIAFTIGAVLITGLAISFYLNVFALHEKPPLILISICVTMGLLALARLCQMIWQRSALQ